MARRGSSVVISLFVVGWLLLFGYETLRANYLSPLAGRPLPKVQLLFPPAGWIMFYRIDPSYGFAEVYGQRARQPFRIEPKDLFATRTLGFDNFHRNLLVGVLDPHRAEPFCRYLRWKLPEYDTFAVTYAQYQDVVNAPDRLQRRVAYQCP